MEIKVCKIKQRKQFSVHENSVKENKTVFIVYFLHKKSRLFNGKVYKLIIWLYLHDKEITKKIET